ncbi:Prolyl 4-hydroxylase, alpha subunit [Parasponia andersonii]|uniref:procollagen-proline 3-dioxygenase n=1 Tax=Parasponia andersonii TaxID=3476 RepID=A0A2P5CIG6_PARAD|nr:Prolyl 4-hydroxylase, alpha subunit [Parasponia andersonii]
MAEEEEEEEAQQSRLILNNFISPQECKELEFIHKSSSTVGYRTNVFSTTLSHLIATNSPHFLMPFIPIRERLKEKVEEFFGCQYELFVEFTGLIGWSRGASIGWHSDDNRPYLKQRHFSAVCYLNSYGDDFSGGLFHFQDGEPSTIVPLRGDVVIYTADSRNVHSVDEIIDGERLTLALWFTRDSSHDEDAKLISLLESSLHSNRLNSWLPLPASSSMYWYSLGQSSEDQLGFDICWARLHVLGFDLLYSQDESCYSDISELLMEPLRLARGNELFDHEFVNILHALQVVQYLCWKASEVEAAKVKVECSKVVLLSELQQHRISSLKSLFLKDSHLAETVFSHAACGESMQQFFDWRKFAVASAMWEGYARELCNGILRSLQYWRVQHSIFNISFDEK